MLKHIIGVLECFRYQAGTYISSVMIFRRVHALVAETPLPNAFGTLFKDVPAAKPAAAAEDTESYDI